MRVQIKSDDDDRTRSNDINTIPSIPGLVHPPTVDHCESFILSRAITKNRSNQGSLAEAEEKLSKSDLIIDVQQITSDYVGNEPYLNDNILEHIFSFVGNGPGPLMWPVFPCVSKQWNRVSKEMDRVDLEYPLEVKLILLGDGSVGKKDFLRRHLPNYPFSGQTLGVEVIPLDFYTNHGKITFKIWLVPEPEKFSGLRDGYYIQGHCAIIMFDVTSRITYRNVGNWQRDLTRVCGDIPIAVCGNKVEIKKNGKVKRKHNKKIHRYKDSQYYAINSVKSNYNIEKPFLWLARKLSGDNKLYFVGEPALYPPKLRHNRDDEYGLLTRLEFEIAANTPLPEEDDDDDDI